MVNGAIGTAVGVGAPVAVALVATSVSLLVANPLIAPLMLLGSGASVGALLGMSEGTAHDRRKKGWLSDLVSDVISSGIFVLVVETLSAQETAIAQEVMKASVDDLKEVSMV